MRCCECDSSHVRVIDTRPVEGGYYRRRRYLCEDCGERFSTIELQAFEFKRLMSIVKRKGAKT